jgi:4-hydroxybenzoyl-CoA reductase alpha subunit
MVDFQVIGKPVPRKDAVIKATGSAKFTNDISLPNMLHGRILRSPYPHARIRNIETGKARKLPGVKAVVTGHDTPGRKYGVFPDSRDQYLLAMDKVRYIGDEVAAVAAIDEETAQAALDLIEVDFEPLAPVFEPLEALEEGAPVIHEHAPDNVSAKVSIEFGDIEKGFRDAFCVLEDRFEVDGLSHCQLEPYTSLASYDRSSGKLSMWMPHQSPFTKQKGLSNTLKIPLENVRVLKTHIGGAFGGRSEVSPSDFCAALLSMQCARPVKISYSREETFSMTRQKHPWSISIKVGADKNGKLMATKVKITADGGAYNSTGAIAISVAHSMWESLYKIPNVSYKAVRAYTNNPIRGAMKGHGAQQFFYAFESILDMLAEKVGLDPLEIRFRNIVKEGEILNSGSRVTSCGVKETLVETSGDSDFKKKWKKGSGNKGIGIACGISIVGFNMGFRSGSTAYLKFNEEGAATLFTGSTDNGQGNDNMMLQVAAEELGLEIDDINLISADTELTPLDPGSYSMSSTFVSANAVKAAASHARKQLFELAAEELEANVSDLKLKDKKVYVKGSPETGILVKRLIIKAYRKGEPVFGSGHFRPDLNYQWDWTRKGRQEGQVTGAYTYGTAVAEVEVDLYTGEVKVFKVTGAHDCGFAINPMGVEGQMEGSVGFCLGQSLSETLMMDKGQMMNANFIDYRIPVASDMPEIDSIIVESNDPNGPYGAKEASEALNAAIIPAIANAIANATGVRPKSLPITPNKMLRLLKDKSAKTQQ